MAGKLEIFWVGGDPPSDASEWERIIEERAEDAVGIGAVKLRKVGDGDWWLEGARLGHIGLGVGPFPPKVPPPLDYRSHLTKALKKGGKSVIGPDEMGAPLSARGLGAIRAAAERVLEFDPRPGPDFDVQVVLDLVAALESAD